MSKKGAIALSGILIASAFLFPHVSIRWIDSKPVISSKQKDFAGSTYVCPMHPEIMQDRPGKCPVCGMDLVPAGNAGHDPALHVDAASTEKLGIRLARAREAKISRDIPTYGSVAYDDNSQFSFNSKFDGWIKKIHVHSVGEQIEKGKILYEIYSPELIDREKKYLQFLQRRDQILQSVGDVSQQENEYVMAMLVEYSRQKESFYNEDVDPEAVRWIEDSRQTREVVKIVADKSGVVTQINAREGAFVGASSPVFTLADLSTVWIDVVLYPDQTGSVKTGDSVSIRDSGGRKIPGKISFISPIAENNKVIARITMDNRKYHLRPGSFVDVAIHAEPHEAILLPRSAVMHTGHGNKVMLFLGNGRFLPVDVETGIERENEIEILDGLQEGAQVAVNGQFLLDAAASLQDAAMRMQSGKMHAK